MLFSFLVSSRLLADDAPPRPTPTFTKDIAPIIFDNCTSCHREGEAVPFPLETYRDVRKRGLLIKDVTESRYMPPWHAAPADVRYVSQRGLTDREIGEIRDWVGGGMPEGDPAHLPSLPQFTEGWQLGEPDLIIQMPEPFEIPADGPDIYRNFAIPMGLSEDKWLKGIEFRPRARSSSHHAIILSDSTGGAAELDRRTPEPGFNGMSVWWFRPGKASQAARGTGSFIERFVGIYLDRLRSGLYTIWTVGRAPQFFIRRAAYRIPRSSDLALQMHFHPSGKRETEQALIGLHFAETAPERTMTHLEIPPLFGRTKGIDIPAGEKHYTVTDSFTTPIDLDVYQMFPHMHYLGKQIKVTATDPDGSVRTLLWVDRWDFNWQESYWLAEPARVPAGARLDVEIEFDNSAENPFNPNDPPKRVRWGTGSSDEMGSVLMRVQAVDEEKMPLLETAQRNYLVTSWVSMWSKPRRGRARARGGSKNTRPPAQGRGSATGDPPKPVR